MKKVAVVGAGIYGCSIALELARAGCNVRMFDPLGIMAAASAINQFRVHHGYHYPRSPETISEIISARAKFISTYEDAIVRDVQTYYGIPREGSMTSSESFESVCDSFDLPLASVDLGWVDYSFVKKTYKVAEEIYDCKILKSILASRLEGAGVSLNAEKFLCSQESDFDVVVYATYGALGSHLELFESVNVQVVEKVLIRVPEKLVKKSLVLVDGPFTAFDPYGASEYCQFGSARYTNHWTTNKTDIEIPSKYKALLNKSEFLKCDFSNFDLMRQEASYAVPALQFSEYLGSKFTIRVVEHDPKTDRRVLSVKRTDPNTIHVFSGKVVSAVTAAEEVTRLVFGKSA